MVADTSFLRWGTFQLTLPNGAYNLIRGGMVSDIQVFTGKKKITEVVHLPTWISTAPHVVYTSDRALLRQGRCSSRVL